MEKIAITLLLIFWSLSLFAQEVEKPKDIPTLEALIAKHRAQLDALKERTRIEGANLHITVQVQESTNKYEELHKKLNKQYNSLSAWASVGINAGMLATDIKTLSARIKIYVLNINKVRNIYVLREYIQSSQILQKEIEYILNLCSKVPLLRSDPSSITSFLLEIQTRVDQISETINRANFMVSGYIALESMKYENSFIDKSKIATKIIRSFYYE